MDSPISAFRIRLSALAFAGAGTLFVLYPAIRPFSEEASLAGAVAFASNAWLLAHTLAIVAFTVLPLGLFGLLGALQDTGGERPGYWVFVLSMLGVGLTLPFYGGETYGLQAIGQAAIRQQDAGLLEIAEAVRSGPGLIFFVLGLLLVAIAGILAAIAIWRSGKYSKWSGVPFAIGFLLFIPQFFWSQPLRIAHGLLVTIGCFWIALEMWRRGE